MNEKEFLKICYFDSAKLQRYVQAGIIDEHHFNENDICLISTLENIGCSLNTIKIYLENDHYNREKCLQILQDQRNKILKDIHHIQKSVDIIDQLINKLKEEK